MMDCKLFDSDMSISMFKESLFANAIVMKCIEILIIDFDNTDTNELSAF
jgi:hypothetical protein